MKTRGARTTPWTLRVYDALPGSPLRIGVVLTVGLSLLFIIGRTLLGIDIGADTNDFRVALTQVLMTTYWASAYAYLLSSARGTTRDLSVVGRQMPDWQSVVDAASKYRRGLLPLLGLANVLIIGVGVTNVTTPATTDPWDMSGWTYDVYWHRVTTAFFVWWIACACYVVVVESARLSKVSDSFESVDLLDLTSYEPLVRQGLVNALVVIGGISVVSLLGVESRYGSVLAILWISSVLLAWVGLMLPLRGIRKKIRTAKDLELAWCRQALISARENLKSGSDKNHDISEIAAYKATIESIRNWPFDNPTLVRFALYLLIPLGSWLGGALVERGVDILLA